MNSFYRILTATRLYLPLGMIGLACGCSVGNQSAPTPVGPSGQALAVTLSASPDTLPRDGSSQSLVTVTARGHDGQPMNGQRLALSLSPSSGGTLSAAEVVTGTDGRATFQLTAPTLNPAITQVDINATPVLSSGDSFPRSLTVHFTGPATPVPLFTVSPTNPQRLQTVTFDASTTTVGGAPCGDSCTYSWNFGTEGSGIGRIATFSFPNDATYLVRLTVTSASGVAQFAQQNVVVSGGTPVAAISVSPTNPVVGQLVRFDGRGSSAVGGATIVNYEWDFGNGEAADGIAVSTDYDTANTFTVRLTVRDSLGRTHTTTQTISITEPTP